MFQALRLLPIGLIITASLCEPADAADARVPALADLSLEQLREIVVTSVSRREQRLDQVAASAYVVGADDIRRFGATTLPEALRLAPRLDVARADANQYAISARGFNNVLANKMLVLIDGRTVYTPLFSGVFWESQDVMLDDVERIEVITGPGTALWGTNAVNGMIHVLTKPAAQTQGSLVSAHAGSRARGAALRHGGQLRPDAHYRVYAKAYDRSNSELASGQPVRDAADGMQLGFRADWGSVRDAVTLQGDVYRASIDQLPQGRRDRRGESPGTVAASIQQRRAGDAAGVLGPHHARAAAAVRRDARHPRRRRAVRFSRRLAAPVAPGRRRTADRRRHHDRRNAGDRAGRQAHELVASVRAGPDRAAQGSGAHPGGQRRAQSVHRHRNLAERAAGLASQ